MATVGSIIATLTARTQGFDKGMARAQKSTKTFQDKVSKARAAVKTFLGAFAIGAALAGIKRFVQANLQAIDSLGKMSDKLGITTEALAAFEIVAARSGVSTNTFNMALQRMIRRVSEAAVGTGEAQEALRELGVDARELASLTPEAAFRRLADAMALVDKQGDRVRLGFKLFDSEGVALVNTLGLGSEALKEAQAEAVFFGTALERIDVTNVERVNDAIDDLIRTLKGAGQEFIVSIAGPLEQIIRDIQSIITAFLFVKTVLERGSVSAAKFELILKGIRVAFLNAGDGAKKFGNEAIDAIMKLDPAFQKLEDTDALLKRMADRIRGEVITPLEKFGKRVAELDTLLHAGQISQETYNRALEKYRKELEAATETAKEQIEVQEELNEKLAEAEEIKRAGRGQQARLSEVANRPSPEQRARTLIAQKNSRLLQLIKENLEKLNRTFDEPLKLAWE